MKKEKSYQKLLNENKDLKNKIQELENINSPANKNVLVDEEEKSYQKLFENVPVGIFLTSSQGRAIHVNPEMAHILGVEDSAEVVENFQELSRDLYVNPHRREEFLEELKENGSVENFEYEARRVDGKHIWLSMNARIREKNDDGSFLIDGFTSDITERKQAEIQLKEKEENLRTTLNSIGDAVVSTDLNGNIMRMNPVAEELTGWDQEEALGKPINEILQLVNAKTRKTVENPVDKVLAEGNIVDLANHTVLISKNGKEYQIADSGAPIKDDDNKITGVVLVFRDVTEDYIQRTKLKQHKKELQEYKNRLEGTMKIGNLAWWAMDIETGAVRFNQKKTEMLGYDKDDFNHYQDFMDLVHPDDYDKAMQAMRDHFQGKEPVYKVDYRIRTKTGDYKWFHDVGGVTSQDENGKPKKVTGVVVDITERKENKEHLEQFFNINLDLLCIADTQGNFIKANKEWEELLGYKIEEIEDSKFFDFVHPEDIEKTEKAMQKLGNQEAVLNFVNRYKSKDGNYRFLEWRSKPSGQYIYAAARDITERIEIEQKQEQLNLQLKEKNKELSKKIDEIKTINKELKKAKKEAEENEATLLAAMENSQAGIAIAEVPSGKLKFVNEAGLSIRDKNYQEIVEDVGVDEYVASWEIRHLDGTPYKKDEVPLAQAVLYGESSRKEFMIRRDDGEKRYVLANAAPIFNDSGDQIAAIVVFLDITDRKKAEESLRHSEALNRSIIENSKDCIKILDTNGTLKFISKGGQELLEIEDVNTVLDESWIDFWKGEHHKRAKQAIQEALDGKLGYFEGYCPTTKGQPKWWGVQISPIYDGEGNVRQLLSVSRDITGRKNVEQEKSRLNSQLKKKNEDLRQILYATSHDLRTPLVNIQGFSRELEDSISELNKIINNMKIPAEVKQEFNYIIDEEIPESIHFITSSAAKMDKLITGLLSLSRVGRQKLNLNKLDINEILDEVLSNLEYEIKNEDIKVDIDELPNCMGDESQINQVFSNLVSNAIKYLEPKRDGEIRISGYKDKKYSYYTIEDNGIGISKQQQKKIFNLFHQGNSKKSGIGLGLNIVKQILAKHEGDIEVQSKKGIGTTFIVALPNNK